MVTRLLSLFILLHIHITGVNAFSSGAGGCVGGMAAVGGSHLDASNGRVVRGASLGDGAIEVRIGSTVLTTNGTVADFPTGQDLQISVNALQVDVPYKGVLVRLEAPAGVNTAAALMSGTNTQIAFVCSSPIIGITHTNSNTKTATTGTIRFDEEVLNVILDITVVFVNNADVSAYAYGRFNANFRAAMSAPTLRSPLAPINSPPMAPVPITVPSSTLDPVAPFPITPPIVAPVPVTAPTPIVDPVAPFPINPPIVAPAPVIVPPIFVPSPNAGVMVGRMMMMGMNLEGMGGMGVGGMGMGGMGGNSGLMLMGKKGLMDILMI